MVRFSDGNEMGPIDKGALRAMAQAGRLAADDLIRRGDSPKWFRARQVKGLMPESPPPESPSSIAPQSSGDDAGALEAPAGEGGDSESPSPISGLRRAHVYGTIYVLFCAASTYVLFKGISIGSEIKGLFAILLCASPGLFLLFMAYIWSDLWFATQCPRCECLNARVEVDSAVVGRSRGSRIKQNTAVHRDSDGRKFGETTWNETVSTLTTHYLNQCVCRYCKYAWHDETSITRDT
jgi:hypothetical protein